MKAAKIRKEWAPMTGGTGTVTTPFATSQREAAAKGEKARSFTTLSKLVSFSAKRMPIIIQVRYA